MPSRAGGEAMTTQGSTVTRRVNNRSKHTASPSRAGQAGVSRQDREATDHCTFLCCVYFDWWLCALSVEAISAQQTGHISAAYSTSPDENFTRSCAASTYIYCITAGKKKTTTVWERGAGRAAVVCISVFSPGIVSIGSFFSCHVVHAEVFLLSPVRGHMFPSGVILPN